MKKLTLKRQFNIFLVLLLVVNTCFYPLANGNKNSTDDVETTISIDGNNDEKVDYESDENAESIVETEDMTVESNELVENESIDESFDVSNIGDEENDLSDRIENENDEEIEESDIKDTTSNDENNESSENIKNDKEIVETERENETKIKTEQESEKSEETEETTTEAVTETADESITENAETEIYETIESEKESVEEKEDVPEVVDDISTASQLIDVDVELNISSISEIDDKIGEEVKNELSYTTLDLLDSNIWTISDDSIKLNSDITLNKPILIDRDLNIDFSNYIIDTTVDDYVFIVVDSTVSFFDGVIKGRNGDIEKPNGSAAISLINSNLTINNCNIYGGNGYSIKDLDETVGDGGAAIIARYENADNKIVFNDGEVVGGTGGTGNVSGVQGIGGLAISGKGISSKKRINGNIFDVENGANGDIGCGNGGVAIMMFGENISIDNIEINSTGIRGGNAGVEIKNTKRKLLKKNKLGADLPTKYNSVENGWTTSLKNQRQTNMCSTFSLCSVAETQLIKKFPEKLQQMGYEEITDIDLSEYAEHFYIFTPPIVYPDYLNSTSYIKESSDVSRYTSGTITEKEKVTDQPLYLIDHATLNSKRLGLTTENKAPLFINDIIVNNDKNKEDLYNLYKKNGKDESPLALNNRVAVLKSAEMLNSNVKYPTEPKRSSYPTEAAYQEALNKFQTELPEKMEQYRKDMAPYVNDLKSRIINSGSILLGLDPGFQATEMEYDGKTIRVLSKVSSGGHVGHCVALVGFDDTFQDGVGAFIAKDSNNDKYYTYIPYDMENGSWEAMDCEFELAPEREVVFSNDQGMAYEINSWMGFPRQSSYGTKYMIDGVLGIEGVNVEKLKAVTVMVPSNINGLNVRVVEVEDTVVGTINLQEEIISKEINAKVGLNYVDFTDENVDLKVGKKYLVTVQYTSPFDIFIDCNDDEGKTIISSNNYFLDTYGWVKDNYNRNPRIKLLTSIPYIATFEANGGYYDGGRGSYNEYYLYDGDITDIKTPTRPGYEFLGYSESNEAIEPMALIGNKWTYTENKTFYAVWQAISYTATFNANGGTYEDNTTSYQKQYTVENNISEEDVKTPTRLGYEFLGYSENDKATEPTTLVGNKWTYTENKTFYAIWRAISYTATFNATGGTYADNTTSYQKQYTVESNISEEDIKTPTRNGYEFLGYSESDEATEPMSLVGNKWAYTENKTFYAVWKEIQQETSETSETETSETETSETETTVAPTTTAASNSNGNRGGGNTGGGGSSGGVNITAIANSETAMLPTANQTAALEKPIGANVVQPVDDANSTKMAQNSVAITITKIAWNYNETIKKWNMLFENETSKNIEFAINGFYKINDNTNVDNFHLNEYVFDAYGNMITGFVADKDGKWYFFDDVENDNIGRKVKGWRKYGESWYYFSNEGVMYQDATTPDGYYVSANGAWTDQNNKTTNTTTTTAAVSPTNTTNTKTGVANPTSVTNAVNPASSTNPTASDTKTSTGNVINNNVGPSVDTNLSKKVTNNSFGPGVLIDATNNSSSKVIGLSNTTK